MAGTTRISSSPRGRDIRSPVTSKRSLAWTKPTTRSTEPCWTTTREWPLAFITSSTSATRASRSTATMRSRGIITVRTGRAANSNALDNSDRSKSSRNPSAAECSTTAANSWAVWGVASSSMGSTPLRRTKPALRRFNNPMSGPNTMV